MEPIRTLTAVLATTVLALAFAGCATRGPGAATPSVSATAEELGAAFADCGPNDEISVATEDFLASTDAWYEVKTIEGQRVLSERNLVTITDTKGTMIEARMFGARWPGIEWAQQTDSHIWVATSAKPEGLVQVVLIITPSGSSFFPGGCLDSYRASVEQLNGERTDELLAGLPFVEQSEVAEYLGVPPDADPDADAHVLLTPDTADPELLASLGLIGIHLTISDPVWEQPTDVLGEGMLTICSRIDAGWNDCIFTGGNSTTSQLINAYVDDTRTLEFWLLNGDADVSKPIGKLGEVVAEGSPITVTIDTSRVTADGKFTGDDRVTLSR